jgi:hypothetical protein
VVAPRTRISTGLTILLDAGVQHLSKVPPSARLALLHARERDAPCQDGFDFTAPALIPSEISGASDFVGIGGKKPEMAHR